MIFQPHSLRAREGIKLPEGRIMTANSSNSYLPLVLSLISLFVSVAALAIAVFRNRLMTKQIMLSSAISLINWLEEVRPQRHLLYKIRDEHKPPDSWSADERAAADNVCRRFDILGLLDNLGYLDPDIVDRFYAIPAYECWEICNDWVKDERTRRGEHHLWEAEQFAQRAKNVREVHPAHVRPNQWPKKARAAARKVE